ncbi:MAG TPA: hypothetical protein VKV24_04475 [Casimicrobiaceae bacterium]|nr:hypothetical protein [Casimicrobiaceae bacterium]
MDARYDGNSAVAFIRGTPGADPRGQTSIEVATPSQWTRSGGSETPLTAVKAGSAAIALELPSSIGDRPFADPELALNSALLGPAPDSDVTALAAARFATGVNEFAGYAPVGIAGVPQDAPHAKQRTRNRSARGNPLEPRTR